MCRLSFEACCRGGIPIESTREASLKLFESLEETIDPFDPLLKPPNGYERFSKEETLTLIGIWEESQNLQWPSIESRTEILAGVIAAASADFRDVRLPALHHVTQKALARCEIELVNAAKILQDENARQKQ